MEIILELCQISAITRKNQIDQVLKTMQTINAKYESGWPVETMDTALITSKITAMSYKTETGNLILYEGNVGYQYTNHEQYHNIGAWNIRINEEGKIMSESIRMKMKDGSEHWVSEKTGLLHRLDGPATIDGTRKAWFKEGKLHRLDGPAAIGPGYEMWCIDGKELTKQEFLAKTSISNKPIDNSLWNTKCRVCGADAYDSGFSYECSGGCNG